MVMSLRKLPWGESLTHSRLGRYVLPPLKPVCGVTHPNPSPRHTHTPSRGSVEATLP